MVINPRLEKQYLSHLFFLASISTIFVIYGSLIPFELRQNSFEQAARLFSGIAYLKLGTSSRADLIANALIYIPVSFFWCGALSRKPPAHGPGPFRLVSIIVILAALAVLIEFLQVFVSPRTVSKNDLISEGVGIVIGCILWVTWGNSFRRLALNILSLTPLPIRHILAIYFIAYLLFSLFPFDFYISIEELRSGLSSSSKLSVWGLSKDGRGLMSLLIFRGVEIFATLPLGYLYRRSGSSRAQNPLSTAMIALLIFAAIDLIQLCMVSGSASLVALVTRMTGVLAGWLLAGHLPRLPFTLSLTAINRLGMLAVIPFILCIAIVEKWSLPVAFTFQQAGTVLGNTVFLPFYYHYYTSELHAFTSLLVQSAIAFPIGAYLYVRDRYRPAYTRFRGPGLLLIGALLALTIEIVGLILDLLRPDPTNIIIGSASVYLAYQLSTLLYNSLFDEQNALSRAGESESKAPPKSHKTVSVTVSRPTAGAIVSAWLKTSAVQKFIAIAALVGSCLYLLHYPLSRPILLAGAVIYLLALARHRSIWLLVIPASIPVADLYIFSGRYFMTELDFLILVTVLFKYWTGQASFPNPASDKPFFYILAALILCYLVSIWQMLYPFHGLNSSSFYSIYSPFNSLRITKSLAWALLLYPVFSYESQRNSAWLSQFSRGMIGGVVALGVVVLIERMLTTGIFDFHSSNYRVKGSFASMHTGDGHIDAYLMMAVPFLATIVSRPLTLGKIALFSAVLCLAGYTIFVTYSRGPYLVTLMLIAVFLCGAVAVSRKNRSNVHTGGIWLLALVMGGLWVSIPIMYDTVLGNRFQLIEKDKDIRMSHWRYAAGLVGDIDGNWFFGNGPGSFPGQVYFDRSARGEPIAAHELVDEYANTFLRTSSGSNIYTSQYIQLDVNQNYLLQFEARPSHPGGSLQVSVCEMWIMDSFRCVWSSAKMTGDGGWSEYQVPFQRDALRKSLGERDGFLQLPLFLSIFASTAQGYIDVDNLELFDQEGRNILANGSFEQGKDYWYFSADNHLLWHTKNIVINLYHDFGIAGLSCVLALILLCLYRNIRMILSGNEYAIILLASLVGFAGIGVVCSIFDVPQLSLLFYLLLVASQLLWTSAEQKRGGSA